MSSVGMHSTGTRISQCWQCETRLPLCEALLPEDARVWLCSQCGTEYSAALTQNYSIDELRGVRPEPVVIPPESIHIASQEMLTFAQQLAARDGGSVEKRNSHRYAVVATLTAIEFDEQIRPVGTPFQTVCRNLSTGGICLINDRAIQSDFLVLELPAARGAPIQTLARIRRRRPLGPYHDIGTEFVTKLATSNSTTLR